MDIEITGYRALYSKSIAGRGVARFIRRLGTAGQLTALINQCLTVILEYTDLYGRVQLNLVGPTLGYAPKMNTQLIIKVLLA